MSNKNVSNTSNTNRTTQFRSLIIAIVRDTLTQYEFNLPDDQPFDKYLSQIRRIIHNYYPMTQQLNPRSQRYLLACLKIREKFR